MRIFSIGEWLRPRILPVIAAAVIAWSGGSAGGAVQVSYLGIQHGSDSRTWEFVYDTDDPAAPESGFDLFETLFGEPVPSGTYTDGFGGTYNYSVMGDAQDGVGLIDFSFGPFVESITLDGTEVAMDPSYIPGWSYSIAGGLNGAGTGGVDAPAGGAWTGAQVGFADRLISDGSFDGWSFGTGTPPFDPLVSDQAFANAERVLVGSLVPEPGRMAFLTLGTLWIMLRRRR